MADTLTRTGARNLTRIMDRVAGVFQNHHESLGIPSDVALDYVKRSDLLMDAVELTAAGNFPLNAAEVDKTPAAKNDPEVPQPSAESAGPTDIDPKSDDQNKPETYYGKGANGEKLAAPEWAQPAKNETGDSVEPGPAAQPHWDANAIADDRGGPYKSEPDESYMGGHFAQNWFHQLRDKQQAGVLPGVDKFAARMALAACLSDITHIARLGALSDAEVRDYIKQLTQMDANLADLQAEIAKVAGGLQKQADQLSGEQKKLLKDFGDKLPETVKGQGKQVVELRDVLLQYTKVASENPPTVAKVRGGVLEQAEEKFGSDVREALEDIFDAVTKENTALKKAVARIQYSRTASDKEAGVMDWLASVQEFFGRVWGALSRIFDMASSAISGSVARVQKSFGDYEKAQRAALKAASGDENETLLRKLLAEEGMNVQAGDDESDDKDDKDDKDDEDKADDKDDEDKADDEDSDDDDDDDDDDEDSDKKAANDFGFHLFK